MYRFPCQHEWKTTLNNSITIMSRVFRMWENPFINGHLFFDCLIFETCPKSSLRRGQQHSCSINRFGLSFLRYISLKSPKSLNHSQVFEGMAPVPFSFISRPKELYLPLFGFNFVLVLLELLLCSNVWVCNRLKKRHKHKYKLHALLCC